MSEQRHIIKKQIIELNLSSEQGAFKIQNEVSRIYRSKIISLLDDLLTKFSDSDKIHRIETLEINLGNIDINNLEQELIDKILAQIQQQLTKKFNISTSHFSTQLQSNTKFRDSSASLSPSIQALLIKGETRENTVFPVKETEEQISSENQGRSEIALLNTSPYQLSMNPPLAPLIKGETRENTVFPVKETKEQISSENKGRQGRSEIALPNTSQLEIFSYFIQTGTLPWWAEKLSFPELEEYCDRLITTTPEQLKSILAESFLEEKYSRRIIYQFSDSSLLKMTQLISSSRNNFCADYYSDMQQIYQKKIDILTNISVQKFRLELWRGIFLILLREGFAPSKQVQFTRNHVLYIAKTFGFNYLSLIDKMLEVTENLKKEKGVFKSQLPKILTQIKPQVTRKDDRIAMEFEQSIKLEEAPPESGNNRRNNLSDTRENSSMAKARLINTVAPFSDSEEIYIYNSGLVLLWPFLPRFFETLKLIQQRNFINSESAEQAILLLQYLVDEETQIPEHSLILNKILCGTDLLEPISANLKITEQQREECEHLLSAVISNWWILKNTSIEGFRRAFLQRKGILKVRDGSWLLQVEQETYDILLDRLPWNISIVKLPWMKEILFVQW